MKFITSLSTLKQNVEKRAGVQKEEIDLSQFLTRSEFEKIESPFPHVVIDDFFKKEHYEALLGYFNSVYERGLVETNDPLKFHPFLNLKGKFAYDGYVHSPKLDELHSFHPFFSVAWNMLFSSLFRQPTGWSTSTALHYHPPGDKTGFIHHDYASKVFSPEDRLPNGVIYRSTEGEHLSFFKERRIISLIYYLGNEAWKEGDGGETGLYESIDGNPVKLIEPRNNRMLAFQISPKSFHAFQKNHTPRSSIVQWFHINERWAQEKYGYL